MRKEIAPGIVARPWVSDDAPAMLEAVDAERERLSRWMPWVPFSTTVADFEAFVERAGEQAREGTGYQLGLHEGDAVVGAIGTSIGSLNLNSSSRTWSQPSPGWIGDISITCGPPTGRTAISATTSCSSWCAALPCSSWMT